ncbi:tripartite tricarboxylate transporter substrate binding protein, partial [Leptospira sp. SA-E8]|uniref:tripartite tricarboxylate transporter substrate binding protein n=1 Tax=Leptospira sp. SA-E8 TaxID=3422259 RepID=UPI003EBA1F07
AGGSTDLAVRALAEEAQLGLGQPVIVKNQPGAAGVLGAQSLLSARPDGYSLAVMPESVYRLPYLQAMPYEPLRDFSPVIQIAGYALGIAARQDAPWRDWAALVDDARRRPGGQISYGSTGLYGTPHMVMEEIAQRLGVEFQHVPYKGEAEIAQALLGGHIDLGLTAGATGPLVEQGRVRLLVVWTAARMPQWPTVPTLRETGLDLVAPAPFGIAGPRGM